MDDLSTREYVEIAAVQIERMATLGMGSRLLHAAILALETLVDELVVVEQAEQDRKDGLRAADERDYENDLDWDESIRREEGSSW